MYGGDITVNADLTSTNLNSAIKVLATGYIANTTGLRTITTNGGAVLFASDTDGNDFGTIRFANGLTIDTRLGLTGSKSGVTTGGGAITLAGGNVSGTGYAAGTSATWAEGIRVDYGLTMYSGGGDIALRGKGLASAVPNGNGSWGVGFWTSNTGSSLIADAGVGKFYMEGISRATDTVSYKEALVTLYGLNIKSAYPGADAIKLVGTNSSTSAGYNYGIDLGGESGVASNQYFTASGTGGGISIIGSGNEWSVLVAQSHPILGQWWPYQYQSRWARVKRHEFQLVFAQRI